MPTGDHRLRKIVADVNKRAHGDESLDELLEQAHSRDDVEQSTHYTVRNLYRYADDVMEAARRGRRGY